jgi:hypothetical protein
MSNVEVIRRGCEAYARGITRVREEGKGLPD